MNLGLRFLATQLISRLSLVFFFSILSGSILSSCVTGPFASFESARTVGQGKDEIMMGDGTPGYVFKLTHGINNEFDLGLQLEQLSVGARAKYMVLGPSSKISMAAAVGVGASGYGSHGYVDFLISRRLESFEPYLTLRITHVNVDQLQFRDENNKTVIARIDRAQFNYGQAFLGSRYWINSSWSLAAEVSHIVGLGAVQLEDTWLGSAAFGYRF